MDVQLPDGSVIQGVPDGTTKADLVAKLQANGKAVPAEWLAPKPESTRGVVGRTADAIGSGLAAYGEAGANLASGAIAAPISGLAGISQGIQNVYNRATGAPVTTSAADAVTNAERALTYEPRGRGGREYVEAVTKPLAILANAGDKAGDVTARGARAIGLPQPVASAAGAAVDTGVQMLPSLIEPGLKAARGKVAAGGAKVAPEAAEVQNAKTADAEAASRAEEYARTRLGVDWSALAPSFQKTLTSIATDAQALDKLPVEAVKRQARLQSLRVPVTTTAAKLSRDSTALRNEANVAATDTGKPIRDIDVQTNRDLRANVEGLRKQVGGVGKTRATAGDEGTAGTAEEVGRQVQERALRTKEAVSKANYNQLYKKARETDPEATASSQAIQDLAKKNPAVQHLDWVPAWFKKAASTTGAESIDNIRLADLQDLREQAVGIARAGGTDGFHAGQVVKAIDETMESGAPNAAKAWKEAQKAFREHKNEFEETAAVERNVADKSKNDPKTALEDTWKKSVQTAKLEEIRQLKRSLLSGGNAETRLAGKKALRELKQETVNQFLQYITRKTATNEAGETQITAVQMVEGLKHVGGEARLREVLGERAVKELKNIIEAAKITKTEPSIRNAGSSTLQNILAFAEKWIDKIPAVGGPVVGGVKLLGKVRELGEKARTVREAVKQPTDAPVGRQESRARNAKRRKQAGEVIRRVAPGAAAGSMTLRDDTDLGSSP